MMMMAMTLYGNSAPLLLQVPLAVLQPTLLSQVTTMTLIMMIMMMTIMMMMIMMMMVKMMLMMMLMLIIYGNSLLYCAIIIHDWVTRKNLVP